MKQDPRAELRALIGFVRGELERDRRSGRRFAWDPDLAGWASKKSDPAHAPEGALLEPSSRLGKPAAAASPAPRTASASRGTPVASSGSKALPPVGLPKTDPRDLDALSRELEEFSREASACVKCGLCETRTNVVCGSGTARQPLMFVGEAPGVNEDKQGLPFVGQAGKLLTDIITAMGFERKEVYIANVLKCRPPENRDPLPDEMRACQPWLERQIEIVRPRVICTLGKYSAQLLTGRKASISTVRGQVFHYRGIPVVPTFHPAYLLRSPSQKRLTWEDVQLARELYLAGESGLNGGPES